MNLSTALRSLHLANLYPIIHLRVMKDVAAHTRVTPEQRQAVSYLGIRSCGFLRIFTYTDDWLF